MVAEPFPGSNSGPGPGPGPGPTLRAGAPRAGAPRAGGPGVSAPGPGVTGGGSPGPEEHRPAAEVAREFGRPIDWVYTAKSRVLKQLWQEVQDLADDAALAARTSR